VETLQTIFTNVAFVAAMIAWFGAQGFKVLYTTIKFKRFDLERVMGSGGMPSSHTASIVAATFAVGHTYGFDHPSFGLGVVVSFIIMYDAAGVRMAAGNQAKVIKMILREIGEHRFTLDRELKELLGHTYLEVFVGMVLGILIGFFV
jgi:acid phosphatase family membrane protein YuiD